MESQVNVNEGVEIEKPKSESAPVHRIVRQFDPSRLTDTKGTVIWSDWNPARSEGHTAISDDSHADDIIWLDEVLK